jgi:Protein of unknown function (DUF416)
MQSILLHSEFVAASLRAVGRKGAFVFGSAICQRIWPTFSSALQRIESESSDELASRLTAVWEFLASLAPSPSPIAPAFEMVIPSPEVVQSDNELFETAIILSAFADSFDRASVDGMLYVSDAALALLDSFIYDVLDVEVSATSDFIVDNHPLVVREIARQKADLSDLSKSDDRTTVLAIWARSRGQSLLEGF